MDFSNADLRTIFRSKRIAVVGDVVADQFLSGTISRVSREAPVFILRHSETVTLPGGAANAAANVASLGGEPLLIGMIGNDLNGELLSDALDKHSIDRSRLAVSNSALTTSKVRVLGGQEYGAKRQVIRIDYENKGPVSREINPHTVRSLRDLSGSMDAIVLSDYGYGVCNDGVFEMAKLISEERSIPLIVDSRFRLDKFAGATSATPNKEEAEAILCRSFEGPDAEELRQRFHLMSLLVTLGGEGMVLAEKGSFVRHFPAIGSSQPVDVTGAGDTVIAAFALALASGLNAAEAASVANHAGSIVVMKRSTSVATIDELEFSLRVNESNEVSAAANDV